MAGLFYWTIQSNSIADPTGPQIFNGLAGDNTTPIASGSVSDNGQVSPVYATSVVNSLTTGTTYKISWVHKNGSVYSNVITNTFVTLTLISIKPTADISAGSWVATPGGSIYSVLDEVSYSDTDYISTSSSTSAEISFPYIYPPNSKEDHIIKFRAKQETTSLNLSVELYQGSTLISFFIPTLTTSYQEFSWTLSEVDAASITDYSNLRIRFVTY